MEVRQRLSLESSFLFPRAGSSLPLFCVFIAAVCTSCELLAQLLQIQRWQFMYEPYVRYWYRSLGVHTQDVVTDLKFPRTISVPTSSVQGS